MTEDRWIRWGGVAGILYVIIALVAGVLTGAAPAADGDAITYQNYFVAKQDLLVAQAWLFPLAVPLLVMFSVAVRRVLRQSDNYLSDLFIIAQTIVAALLVVTMSLQMAVAQAASDLDSHVVYTIGVHFPAVAIMLFGFTTGIAAAAYAICVFKDRVLMRWTAYFAVLAIIVCVGSTFGAFLTTGPFSPEGEFGAFAPAISTIAWYLAASVTLTRTKTFTASPSNT